jgi:hypothetical protein
MSHDKSMAYLLVPVYMRVMGCCDLAARFETYSEVKYDIERGYTSINALLPFILIDLDTSIVSNATADMAMLGPTVCEDELAWPRTIVSYLEQRMGENRGAIFGGLVSLGDRRVNALLDTVKWTFTDTDVITAARCWSGFPTLAAFEFWLSWLEELMAKGMGESALFGACASALPLILDRTHVEYVTDVERNFGYGYLDNRTSAMRIIDRHSIGEVGVRFAARLYALEAQEQPPKLISHVLDRYGLDSMASEEDRYIPQ